MNSFPETPQQAVWQSIADQINEAKTAIKAWEVFLEDKKRVLSELHAQGYAPSEFEHSGLKFKLNEGRKTMVLDKEYKAKVTLIQEEALKKGHAEIKQGSPFWTVKEAK